MKVLLIGGGAREHAMAWALKRNEGVELYSALGNRNPGIMGLSEEVLLTRETELGSIRDFALSRGVDIAVVGPEKPLGEGAANVLEENGIPTVGPKKELARIETSKEFCRDLMEKYNIPSNLRYACFDDLEEAQDYVDNFSGQVVVKPVGLTGGKGVKVEGEHLKDREEVKSYIEEVIKRGIGGGKVVVEERARGEEFSVQAFVYGERVVGMPVVQDHKRAFEGDVGYNTGGMGSYSMPDGLLPFVSQEDYDFSLEVMRRTAGALEKETGIKYKGVLYGQFMKGKDIKLIEFNCRFGDPEAMNVLPLLKTDYSEICRSIAEGVLPGAEFAPEFAPLASVCKYVVPEGYGKEPAPPAEINVDSEAIAREGARLFYAAVNQEGSKLYTSTSRALALVGIDETLEGAEKKAERAMPHVKGEHVYHRRDIGTRGLLEEKIRRMEKMEP